MLYYHIDNDLSKAWGVDSDFDWFVMNHLFKPIDDDEYQVVAISFLICRNWQTRDKIHQ